MKLKYYHLLLIFLALIVGCNSIKSPSSPTAKNLESDQKLDTIEISNDSLEYKVIILEIGFNSWLVTQRPRGFYSKQFLEIRNRQYVAEYNSRFREPTKYSRDLYPFEIDYNFTTDYGYEVNYLLYHYFLFFEQKYNLDLRY